MRERQTIDELAARLAQTRCTPTCTRCRNVVSDALRLLAACGMAIETEWSVIRPDGQVEPADDRQDAEWATSAQRGSRAQRRFALRSPWDPVPCSECRAIGSHKMSCGRTKADAGYRLTLNLGPPVTAPPPDWPLHPEGGASRA